MKTKSFALATAFLLCCLLTVAGFGQVSHQSGVLWYNPSTGEVGPWLQNSVGHVFAKPTVARKCPSSSCFWELVGTGDFNNDGFPDVLWYNPSTGQVGSWLLDGAGQDLGVQFLTPTPCPQPGCKYGTPVGVGDFNNDGHQDVLWYNSTTGKLDIWLLDGNGNYLPKVPSPHLVPQFTCPQPCQYGTIVGVGNFTNNDGNQDILWYNSTTGVLTAWLLDGNGNVYFDLSVNPTCDPTTCGSVWSVVGVGDFNNDGHQDVLWYNHQTGQVGSWLLDGTGNFIPTAGDLTVGHPGLQFLDQKCDPASCLSNWFPLATIRFGPTIFDEKWNPDAGTQTGTLTLSGAYFTNSGRVDVHYSAGQNFEQTLIAEPTNTLAGTFTAAQSGIGCDNSPGPGVTVDVTDIDNPNATPPFAPLTTLKLSTPCQ